MLLTDTYTYFLKRFIRQTLYTKCTRMNCKIVPVTNSNRYVQYGASGNEVVEIQMWIMAVKKGTKNTAVTYCWMNILWLGNIYVCGVRHQLDVHFYSGSLPVTWGVRMCCVWRQVGWVDRTECLTLRRFQFGYTSSLTNRTPLVHGLVPVKRLLPGVGCCCCCCCWQYDISIISSLSPTRYVFTMWYYSEWRKNPLTLWSIKLFLHYSV